MVQVFQRDLRPNQWDSDAASDPRCESLLDLYEHIRAVFLGPDEFPPPPSELALMFRQQAELIDLWTDYDRPVAGG